MLKVVFHHPPNVDNPFLNFDPNNSNQFPNEKGIYIYGLKLDIVNSKKFVPIIVGIHDRLTMKDRLGKHYNNFKTNGKGKKELWDFCSVKSMDELKFLYSEMHVFDIVNDYQNGIDRTAEVYLNLLVNLKRLLFFQNRNYFILRNNLRFDHSLNDNSKRELHHLDAIKDFGYISEKIKNNKSLFSSQFYYVYAKFDDVQTQILQNEINGNVFENKISSKNKLECIEYATKKALNILGIHTTARKEPKAEILDMDIDFSEIKEELVNIGGHPYNFNGKYIDKLLINIRK